jgi:hypothetical protein
MNDEKSINEWMRQWGYTWVEGEERMYKAPLNWVDAESLIESLRAEGAVRRG